MDNQKPDSQQACCTHVQVVRFQIENAGRVFEEQWRCKDCGAKFVNLDSFFAGPQRIEVMEPIKTLRDEFAIAALVAIIGRGDMDKEMDVRPYCDDAYTIADAMLEAREP